MDRDGSESLQVATTEAEHHAGIVFIKVHPGGWRVNACSVPPAAVSESGDEVFVFAALAAVLSSDMLHMLCAWRMMKHINLEDCGNYYPLFVLM